MIEFTLGKGTTEERTLQYDDSVLMSEEVVALQKVTGRTIQELLPQFFKGDMEAIIAFVWLAERREATTNGTEVPRYTDINFNINAFAMTVHKDPEEAVPVDPSPELAKAPRTKKK